MGTEGESQHFGKQIAYGRVASHRQPKAHPFVPIVRTLMSLVHSCPISANHGFRASCPSSFGALQTLQESCSLPS